MKITVLYNPDSGTAPEEEGLRTAFEKFGADVELLPLSGTTDAETLHCRARECDVFVAAGGDGTVSTAAGLLASSGSRAALGVVPSGTCNDFSRTIRVPADLDESARIVVRGRSVPLDLIAVSEGRFAVNQINGGFSGAVAHELEFGAKSGWQPLSYARATAAVLREMPEYDLRLTADGETTELRVLNLTIANGRFAAGGVPTAPLAEISDGLLDVVAIEKVPGQALVRLLPRILRGGHLEDEHVFYRRARRLELGSEPGIPLSVDGEPTETGFAELEVRPSCISVRVP